MVRAFDQLPGQVARHDQLGRLVTVHELRRSVLRGPRFQPGLMRVQLPGNVAVGIVSCLSDVPSALMQQLQNSRAHQPPTVVLHNLGTGQPTGQELALS